MTETFIGSANEPIHTRIVEDPAQMAWHLDKRVPVAIIISIAVQTCGAIWWAATVNQQVANGVSERIRMDTRIERIEDANPKLRDRLTAVETKIDFMNKTLESIANRVGAKTP